MNYKFNFSKNGLGKLVIIYIVIIHIPSVSYVIFVCRWYRNEFGKFITRITIYSWILMNNRDLVCVSVCVYVSVSVCVCICVCMYVYGFVYIYVAVCVCMCPYVYMWVCVSMAVFLSVNQYAEVHLYILPIIRKQWAYIIMNY